ncbi:MAG: FAD-dependent oxidoreductase, partial [Treponema sp.]|nr:FAD-dependent oxidoreductase [Spirochaetales bacterium]MDY6189024.1 FAD-dependent oxidoreductase [Treponema sp.]
EKIYYIPLYKKESFDFSPKIEVIFDEPLSIDGEKNVSSLKLKNHEISVQGIFILRSSISPSQLISGIELEENHIKVDRNMKTNIEGVFASGDITGKPYQYAKACGEGNVAALSVVSYLSNIE